MMRGRRKERRGPLSNLLVALLLSVLLHQVVLTGLGFVFSLPEEKEERKYEVALIEDPLPKKEKRPEPQRQKAPVAERETPPRPVRPTPKPPPPAPGVETPDMEAVQPEAVEQQPEVAEPTGPEKPELKLSPDWSSFETTFAEIAKKEREAYAEERIRQRGTPLRFGALFDKVKKALGSNKGWVNPGNQEPLGARQQLFSDYIWVIHEKIHQYFADSFLASLSVFAPDDPINDFSLNAMAEFEILENGSVNEVRIVRSSGNYMFDSAAVDSIYRSSPHPPPPKQILSWNRRLYLRWGFYRNQRKCGVFNAEPYILRAPGAEEEPIPEDQLIIDDG